MTDIPEWAEKYRIPTVDVELSFENVSRSCDGHSAQQCNDNCWRLALETKVRQQMAEIEELKKDAARIKWLQANTYAFVLDHANGKGFMRFSAAYRDDPEPEEYNLRDIIDEAMKGKSVDVQE